MKPELGSDLTVTVYYKRITKFIDNGSGWRTRMKIWNEVTLKEPKTVKIIGIRTLSNGKTDYDSDVGHMYDPKQFFQAILVVESLSRKPFYVPATQFYGVIL